LVVAIKTSMGTDFEKEAAEKYAAYCERTKYDKNRDGLAKNPWFQKKTVEELEGLYRRVTAQGIPFDGEHVTFQSTGISYDYVAYKNRMLLAYPESQMDVQLVFEGDAFTFSKSSGAVVYDHMISDPFNQTDEKVIGAYAVIKNKRGEFLVTLGKEDIAKHRKVAKTDYIWKAWFKEMVMKTVMKKACKYHFQDLFVEIEEMDNENYDLEKSRPAEERLRERIIDELRTYQGDDKKDIQQMCAEKAKAKEFDEKFGRNILEQMGVNHGDIS
jgi:hypothetical protein